MILQIAGERDLTCRNLQHDRFCRHLHFLLERHCRDTRMKAFLHFLTTLVAQAVGFRVIVNRVRGRRSQRTDRDRAGG